MEPIHIIDESEIATYREKAWSEKNDELLGAIEAMKFGQHRSLLEFPICAVFPDPPDVILQCATATASLEVTRLAWQRLSQVEQFAQLGDCVEMTQELCVNGKARKGAPGKRGHRSGDYRHIKKPGDKSEGDAWIADKPEKATIKLLQATVEKKMSKFGRYTSASNIVWLFLVDYGFPCAWQNILQDPALTGEVTDICKASSFDRVFLFRFSFGMREIFDRSSMRIAS